MAYGGDCVWFSLCSHTLTISNVSFSAGGLFHATIYPLTSILIWFFWCQEMNHSAYLINRDLLYVNMWNSVKDGELVGLEMNNTEVWELDSSSPGYLNSSTFGSLFLCYTIDITQPRCICSFSLLSGSLSWLYFRLNWGNLEINHSKILWFKWPWVAPGIHFKSS